MTKSNELEKICTILDKLTLDTLTLMEEEIQLKLNLEDSMNDGALHLAKSRYILGHSNVSSLQLPTECSQEIDAVTVVHTEDNEKLGYKMYDVEIIKRAESNSKIQEPLKWFGVLVPQNLHAAQDKFRQALTWINEIVNVQSRLDYNCKKIGELRNFKSKILKIEE